MSSKTNSFKNNIFQMQKLLVNILIRAYNFKMKRIPSSFKHFYAKKQNVMFYHPTPYNCPSLFIGHQTVAIMNHCCYYFDGPWKVKALYVIIMSRTHFRVNIHSVVP